MPICQPLKSEFRAFSPVKKWFLWTFFGTAENTGFYLYEGETKSEYIKTEFSAAICQLCQKSRSKPSPALPEVLFSLPELSRTPYIIICQKG